MVALRHSNTCRWRSGCRSLVKVTSLTRCCRSPANYPERKNSFPASQMPFRLYVGIKRSYWNMKYGYTEECHKCTSWNELVKHYHVMDDTCRLIGALSLELRSGVDLCFLLISNKNKFQYTNRINSFYAYYIPVTCLTETLYINNLITCMFTSNSVPLSRCSRLLQLRRTWFFFEISSRIEQDLVTGKLFKNINSKRGGEAMILTRIATFITVYKTSTRISRADVHKTADNK